MKKSKYYVVWKGREPGVYTSWDDCRQQVEGFAGAMYKAFETRAAADAALQEPPARHVFKKDKQPAASRRTGAGTPIHDSIVVDAAWNSVQKDMEYQGIFYKTGKRIFHNGPLANGTNNIGEFLAIVHALAYCQKHQLPTLPIYSDSRNAIGWVKQKKCKTNLEESARTQHIFELIRRAEQWLQQHTYRNPILKWETADWGENPADFGRK
ncbi:MAG TPA: ribonuclease H family protein [Lacibacter sp.]|nr:ribonuclease H family protein [Lacibacter sp.]HMO87643.1 ribonuclease H family protein [Lacibacter sp.]HMP88025.1 ribonuclease H family protein [Lacibacter sp.]